ncbi:hypothetical protein B0H34DRAFT_859994 [Crassisporium funariophilum]|nr:hypothetical protein B0H34DRAFT_859994 [Crassisporium funariophilum]
MDPHRLTGSQQPSINITIPADVLCEIMVQTKLISNVDTTDEQDPQSPIFDEKSKLDMTPLRLSHVCASWRTLANGLPSLWNSISIMGKAKILPELLESWLDRGMDCPITIYLRQMDATESTIENLLSALSILGPHMHRWKSLTIHLDPKMLIAKPILDRLRALLQHSRLTLLQSLDVKAMKPIWAGMNMDHDRLFIPLYEILCPASPSLDTIKLGVNGSSRDYIITMSALPIPLVQLKHLHITDFAMHPYEFIDALSEYPHLQTLSCRNCLFDDSMAPGFPAVLLNRLRVFIIICDYDSILFDYMTLPNLRDFKFVAGNQFAPENWSAERVKAMLGRSACQLDHFTYQCFSKEPLQLPSEFLTLPAFASLQSLTMNSGVTAALVKDLTVLPNSGPEREWESQSKGAVLLLHLTSLVLVGCPVEDGLLLEMAQSRVCNSSCAHLEYLRVQASWEHEASHARDVDGFQKLREEGLEFSLTFSSKPSLSS